MFIYMISFVFVVNMDEWFLIWFGLELNMLSFMVLVYQRNSMINIESCMKYFFIQSLGSAILMSGFYLSSGGFEIVSCLVLGYKMGGGPFFFWFPSLCEGISWFSCFILMSFQKFLPMILLSKVTNWSVWIIIVVSLLAGVFGSFNQNNVKRFMAFSSIHQIGWMLMVMLVDEFMWFMYYLIYVLVLWPIILKLKSSEVMGLTKVHGIEDKWWMVLMFLNMGGMPPMLGFFLKWLGLYYFMDLSFFMVVLMIFMSIIMFYMYLRVCYNMIMGEDMKISWMSKGGLFYRDGIDTVLLVGVLVGGVIVFVLLL